MNEQLTFRKANPGDAARILEIIRQAQAQMRARGSEQWQDGYPAPEHIDSDLTNGYGWVLCKAQPIGSRSIIAYGAVLFDREPAYDALQGQWLSDQPYVMIHRLAVADEQKGRGIATEFFRRTELLARERGIGSFRVDTNYDNSYMLRLLDKQGFVDCGKVVYRSGERMAFEKLL